MATWGWASWYAVPAYKNEKSDSPCGLICAAYLAKAQTPTATPTPPPRVIETYKVVNGMNIRATVYNVEDGKDIA